MTTLRNNEARIQAGIDFPGNFEKDNFDSRRTTGNNMFDPDGFITGQELADGFTYANSRRVWASEQDYQLAAHGYLRLATILNIAPRGFIPQPKKTPRQVLAESEYIIDYGCIGWRD